MTLWVLLLMFWMPHGTGKVELAGVYGTEQQCFAAVQARVKKGLDKMPNGTRVDAGCAMFKKEEAI